MVDIIATPLHADVYKLTPSSMWRTLTCCVMYDEHPRDKKKIEITVCLQQGRVIELYQRECVSSINLSVDSNLKQIQIIRNNNGDLFYLVEADHEVIILSSTDQLSIYQRFSNIIDYDICDPECSGECKLMIRTESSPLYISFSDTSDVSQQVRRNSEDSKPVIFALKQKLTEAKYNMLHHEEAYKHIENLRQQASFICYSDSALQMETPKPIIRFCNKKIIIQLEIENPYSESINKVCVLIHNNSCHTISYTSIVYEHLATSPFYKEIESREIRSKCKASIVAVIPISEFKGSIRSRVDFSVVVSYGRQGQECLQSFDDINISAADMMGQNFDVFNSPETDVYSICLGMLSTTDKTTLSLKHKGLGDMISPSKIFHKYLDMDLLGETKSVAIHKHSPHHILHGIMIIFDDDYKYIDANRNEINYNIDVYSRSSSQVMALIHFIYDKVPLTLIVTTPNIQVASHGDPDEGADNASLDFNYTQCGHSLLKQSSMTLQYLDNCLQQVNNTDNLGSTDIQFDLFANGRDEFEKYRSNMIAEAENALENLVTSSSQVEEVVEMIEMD